MYLDTSAPVKPYVADVGSDHVELDHDVLARARALIQRHALRGFDGIHLASALHLYREVADPMTFVAADDRLLRAAAAEGLAAVVPAS
jgi:hypothetical protein